MPKKAHKQNVLISTICIWIGFGTIAFRMLEQWTWIDAFYFSVTTLTTVGFGDLHPTTQFSKLFAAIYVLVGVGIVITAIGYMGQEFIQKRETPKKKK